MLWMLGISLLLFFLPLAGPFIGGLVGGKKAGGVLNATMAALVPSLAVASLLLTVSSSLASIPIIGAFFTVGSIALAFAGAGPLLLGAILGGLFTGADARPVSMPATVFVICATCLIGWRVYIQVQQTVKFAASGATAVANAADQVANFRTPASDAIASRGVNERVQQAADQVSSRVAGVLERVGARAVIPERGSSPATETQSTGRPPDQPPAPLGQGLAAWWTFDNADISGSTAVDRSGNGSNATIYGATPVAGRIGQALSFDGSSNWVLFPPNIVTGGDQITVSAWVLFRGAYTNWPRIVLGGHPSRTYGLFQEYGGYRILWRPLGEEAGPRTVMSSRPLSSGEWHHLVGTYDGSLSSDNVKLHIDGALDAQATQTGSIPRNDSGGAIGGETLAHGETPNPAWFSGLIDDVRIYTRALSASEIKELYQAGGGS